MLNLLSIPVGGMAVSLLSEKTTLQNIILLAFALSLVLTMVLLFVGRLKFGYKNISLRCQKRRADILPSLMLAFCKGEGLALFATFWILLHGGL